MSFYCIKRNRKKWRERQSGSHYIIYCLNLIRNNSSCVVFRKRRLISVWWQNFMPYAFLFAKDLLHTNRYSASIVQFMVQYTIIQRIPGPSVHTPLGQSSSSATGQFALVVAFGGSRQLYSGSPILTIKKRFISLHISWWKDYHRIWITLCHIFFFKMHLMYYMDGSGKRVYTLKVSVSMRARHFSGRGKWIHPHAKPVEER